MPDHDRRPRVAMVAKAGATVMHLKYTTNSIAFCNETASASDLWYPVADNEVNGLQLCGPCDKRSAGRQFKLVSRPPTSDRPQPETDEDKDYGDEDESLDVLARIMSGEDITASADMGPGVLQLYPALASDICRVLYSRLSSAQLVPVPYLTLAKLLYWARQLGGDLHGEYVKAEIQENLAPYMPPGYLERMTLAEIMRTYGPRTAPETDGAPSGTTTA